MEGIKKEGIEGGIADGREGCTEGKRTMKELERRGEWEDERGEVGVEGRGQIGEMDLGMTASDDELTPGGWSGMGQKSGM